MAQIPPCLIDRSLGLTDARVIVDIALGYTAELGQRRFRLTLERRKVLPCTVQVALRLIERRLRGHFARGKVKLALIIAFVI
jgi:hypothetical protein